MCSRVRLTGVHSRHRGMPLAAYHCLDVAAVLEILLGLFPQVPETLARAARTSLAEATSLLVFLTALHDVGKFSRGFQAKASQHWPAILGPMPEPLPTGD